MTRSNYEEFMDCYNEWEPLFRAAICGSVIWKCIQEHKASGLPITDADAEEAAREAERQLALTRGELYAYALMAWADRCYPKQTEQSDTEAAEENGGFSISHYNNST